MSTPLRRFAEFVSSRRAIAWALPWLVPPVDRAINRATAGRIHLAPYPTLYLTTRGRKTGRGVVTPLLYVTDGDRLAVVATNFGKPRHPDWSANLLAEPRAIVEINGRRGDYRARLAGGEERAVFWERLVSLYPGFARFAVMTERDVRLFVLEPDPGSSL